MHHCDYHSTARLATRALAVVSLVLAGDAAASAATTLETVQAWLDGTRDLQGHFRQVLLSGAMGAGLEESGTFYVERPGRMRWDYTDPERKMALVEGRQTLLYLEEDAQLFRGTLEGQGEFVPRLLAGEGRLSGLFVVEAEAPAGKGRTELTLLPREGSDWFEQVLLAVRSDNGAVVAAEVLDPAGNRMQYEFSELQRNAGLPVGVFYFEPPPGTEISGP